MPRTGRMPGPRFLAPLFDRPRRAATLLAVALPLALALAITLFAQPGAMLKAYPDSEGSFYAVMPHRAMAGLFGAAGLFVLSAIGIGVRRFWRETGEPFSALFDLQTHRHALQDALRLRYLGGGDADDGCTYPADQPSLLRRRFHHLTFYGFLLCFAATSVATVYHYGLGWKAPYPLTSLPVFLGTLGGLGLLGGPVGQLWLVSRRDPQRVDGEESGMDIALIALLLLASVTGLALLVWRQSTGMGLLLALHLGVVAALFLTMPYGKFVHGFYRYLALFRYALERARPAPRFAAD